MKKVLDMIRGSPYTWLINHLKGIIMKRFEVTAIIDGIITTWVAYGNSVGHIRHYIVQEWNASLKFDNKIVRIKPI